jgi:hypothetical protein
MKTDRAAIRKCWFCGGVLVNFPRESGQRQEHCSSPACHWCLTCQRRKFAERPL